MRRPAGARRDPAPQPSNRAPRLRRVGAILSMELVLVLPVFMLVMFSVVEFSMLSSAQTRLNDAARHGSRLLCLGDQSHDDVRQQVQDMLGTHLARNVQVEIQDSGQPGELVNVVVQIPMANASPDLLWLTGFSVRNRVLAGSAPMAREHDIATARIERL